MQPLYLLEAVDVRRADQPDSSRALTVSKLALPAIKFMTAEHKPGGGVGAVSFVLPQIEAVEPKFELKGFDADILANIGLLDGTQNKWVFAGAVREKRTGRVLPARAVIEGIVAEWEPEEHSAGEFVGCNHVLHEVTHYEFQFDGRELWYWDFWERIARRGGNDRYAAIRTALGG
jgi:uncharacterized protein